jgi:hypothetical protein
MEGGMDDVNRLIGCLMRELEENCVVNIDTTLNIYKPWLEKKYKEAWEAAEEQKQKAYCRKQIIDDLQKENIQMKAMIDFLLSAHLTQPVQVQCKSTSLALLILCLHLISADKMS